MSLASRLRHHLADTRPLQVDEFRRLWVSNIITVIGAQLTVVSVPAQIWAITQDSGYVGLTGVFGLVPLVIFGLWGGAMADVHDRRAMLMVTTTGIIVTSLAFWVQAALGINNVWLILTIFALQQAFFGLNQPVRAAILPRLVPDELLPAANSLNMTVFMFGGIAGPLVGGALIPVLGFAWLYFIDAVTLLATFWAVWKLPHLPPLGEPGSRAGFRSIVDGLAYLRGRTILVMSFVVDLIAMIFGMPRGLFPQLANQNYGGPLTGGLALAVLFAAIPVGGLFGGIFSGWVSRVQHQGRAVVVSIGVWGLGVVGFGLASWWAGGTPWPWLAIGAFMLAVGGAADMASAAFRQSMLMEAASDEVRGRLQGIFFVVVVGGPRVADVLHGWAARPLGAAPATALGGLLVVLGMVACVVLAPTFWRYRPERVKP